MIPNITRGGDTHGLLRYLVGEGRANEHENPHIIATSPIVASPVLSDMELSYSDAASLADQLDMYMNFYDVRPQGLVSRYDFETGERHHVKQSANHVWHCSLSLSPDHEPLSDEMWASVVKDYMDMMGFTTASGKAHAPWVAIHHGASKNGGDHVHIAANVVREDGTKVALWEDFQRSQKTCTTLEKKYGLRVLDSRVHGRGSINDSAASLNRAHARGEDYTDRAKLEMIIRAVAMQAGSEADFVRLLRSKGVLALPRYASNTTSVVTGYKVALRPGNGEKPAWYGGGRIARDLTLTRLRTKWEDSPQAIEEAVTAWNERGVKPRTIKPFSTTITQQVEALRSVGKFIKNIDPSNPVALADAAHNVSGILAHLAMNTDDKNLARDLTLSARQVGRAAQLKVRPHVPHVGTSALLNVGLHLATMPMRQVNAYTLAREALVLAVLLARTYKAVQQLHTAHVINRDLQAAYVKTQESLKQLSNHAITPGVMPVAAQTRSTVNIHKVSEPAGSINVPNDVRSIAPDVKAQSVAASAAKGLDILKAQHGIKPTSKKKPVQRPAQMPPAPQPPQQPPRHTL